MKIAVLGAGAWGTALALQASVNHNITLWARSPELVASMQASRTNDKYLPGYIFPESLKVSCEPLGQELHGFDLIIIATPMSALRSMLKLLSALSLKVPVVWLCKGFEAPQEVQDHLMGSQPFTNGLLAHEILASVAPQPNCWRFEWSKLCPRGGKPTANSFGCRKRTPKCAKGTG